MNIKALKRGHAKASTSCKLVLTLVTFLFIDHRLTNNKFLMYWIEVTDFDHLGN